jgi:hypothetical protein
MSQTIDNLQMLLLLLISNSANGDSSEINAIILTLLTIMNFDDDLHRLRPSNFYPPEGFIQRAAMMLFGTVATPLLRCFSCDFGSDATLSLIDDCHGTGWQSFYYRR